MKNSVPLRITTDRPCVLESGRISELRIDRGIVWLTVTGGSDIFLSAGQRFALDPSGKVVIETLHDDAHITIYPKIYRIAPFAHLLRWLSESVPRAIRMRGTPETTAASFPPSHS